MIFEPNFDRFRRNCEFLRVFRARSRMYVVCMYKIRLQQTEIAPIIILVFDFQSQLDGSMDSKLTEFPPVKLTTQPSITVYIIPWKAILAQA